MTTIGDQLRSARERRGLTMRQLAREVGVSAATISAIENGRTGVSVERLRQLGDALGVSAAALLGPIVYTSMDDPHPTSQDWRDFSTIEIEPVLQAAIRAFVHTGYHGASMRAIAAEASMSVPGVYHHYASKQELLVQILDLTMDQLEARTSSAVAQGHDPLERLSLLVEALALFHTMCSDLAFIGASEMRSLEQPHFDRIARRRTALQHLIDAHIDAAIVAGQASTSMPREAGRAIATMCTSLPQWFSKGGPTSPEEIAREYARLAVRMVGGEPR